MGKIGAPQKKLSNIQSFRRSHTVVVHKEWKADEENNVTHRLQKND
jgi:hypothetical protein